MLPKGSKSGGISQLRSLSYQSLLAGNLGQHNKIVLNTYIARAAAAAGNQEVARKAYKSIILTDSTFRCTQTNTVAAFAWLEMIGDLVRQGKNQDAMRKTLECYERLLEFYPHLTSDQYRYVLQKIHSRNCVSHEFWRGGRGSSDFLATARSKERFLTRLLARGERIEAWLKNQHTTLFAEDAATRVHHYSLLMDGKPTATIIGVHASSCQAWLVCVTRSRPGF